MSATKCLVVPVIIDDKAYENLEKKLFTLLEGVEHRFLVTKSKLPFFKPAHLKHLHKHFYDVDRKTSVVYAYNVMFPKRRLLRIWPI